MPKAAKEGGFWHYILPAVPIRIPIPRDACLGFSVTETKHFYEDERERGPQRHDTTAASLSLPSLDLLERNPDCQNPGRGYGRVRTTAFSNDSLKRSCSIHSFRYGCLVTTSSLSPNLPCSRIRGPSGTPGFLDVTGSEYKARERIHRGIADPRLLAIPTS